LKAWRRTVLIVQPASVVFCHRRDIARRKLWRSRCQRADPTGGRLDIRDLIRHKSHANPLFGALRMHGDLRKLGIEVSEATVAERCQASTRPTLTKLALVPDQRSRLQARLASDSGFSSHIVEPSTP
jgi:hypothetical protein